MRSLRERLNQIVAEPKKNAVPQPERLTTLFFCREHVVPIAEVGDIEHTTLEEIKACDPMFEGTQWGLDKLLLIDTETTGLSGGAGTLAFEIGVGFFTADGLVIRQFVMRDYNEEAAMLAALEEIIRSRSIVISFNGKGFDVPLIESRMTMHRIRSNIGHYPHFDLLHVCRRIYKLRLKHCNLSALEEAVLGQTRKQDLPGAEVPARYFEYLKTREFALLEDVLSHNLMDVKSLASLTGHVCAAFRAPEQLAFAEDVFSIGKTLMRGGHIQKARGCFKILGHSSMSAQAHMHLATGYKREKAWSETAEICRQMIACGEGGAWPHIELAKYYEHIERDPGQALLYAKRALMHILNREAIRGADEKELQNIRRRIARLQRKSGQT